MPTPTISKTADDANGGRAQAPIERDHPRLKGALLKDYARPGLDTATRDSASLHCEATPQDFCATKDHQRTHGRQRGRIGRKTTAPPSYRPMPDLTPEHLARQQIDAQLATCGWVVQDFKSADFSAGRGIALSEVPLTTGPCDYLLLVNRKAHGVIEAKKESTTFSTVVEQSARYASRLAAFLAAELTGTLPFHYESTGVETIFRDERDPAPRSRRIFTLHCPETLAAWVAEPDTPRARRKAMLTAHPLATNGMRDCQTEAITGLEQSFAACAFTFRLIQYAKAHRVLFLVDRANLGKQARDEFPCSSVTTQG